MGHHANLSVADVTPIIMLFTIYIACVGAAADVGATVENYAAARTTLDGTDGRDVMRQHRIAGTKVRSAELDGQRKREIYKENQWVGTVITCEDTALTDFEIMSMAADMVVAVPTKTAVRAPTHTGRILALTSLRPIWPKCA